MNIRRIIRNCIAPGVMLASSLTAAGRFTGLFPWALVAAAAILLPPASLAASKEENVDACALATAEEVAALITPRENVDIHGASSNSRAGESVCVWSVAEENLLDGAPPAGTLTLTHHHFANPARAAAEMKRLTMAPAPPSLVRTADLDDQVLRTDEYTTLARHGSDIVTIDTYRVNPAAHRRAGWLYRVEALAFKAAGATVRGPADERDTQSLCKMVAPAHILALLTLQPSTLKVSDRPDDDGVDCSFSVRDGSNDEAGAAWTKNRGDARLERRIYGNAADALKQLHTSMPFARTSTLVRTTDAGDAVIVTADVHDPHFDIYRVDAVHGPYLVTLTLDNYTPEARAHPSFAYRAQRTALEAAGATIIPGDDAGDDPVTPGPVPRRAAAAQQQSFAWHTSGHAVPSESALLDPVLLFFAFMARHRFAIVFLAVFGSFALGGLIKALRKRSLVANRPSAPRFLPGWLGNIPAPGVRVAVLLVACAIVNIILGPAISNALIYHFGEEGQATITGFYATSVQYNNHNVVGYNVLIKMTGGSIVETAFTDDEFNVYPSHNTTRYPNVGAEFNVRYIKHFPRYFVILGEDDSPWAHGLRCGKLDAARSEAETRLGFAPDRKSYQQAVDAAVKAEADAGCGN